jgi:hypothetical protein
MFGGYKMTDSTIAYTMSEIGGCERALCADRLGNKPTALSAQNLKDLAYYTMCESLVAQQLMNEGFRIESGGLCLACKSKYGIERQGIHVEMSLPLFNLIGHLDRRVVIGDKRYPVEIKSLGKGSYDKFWKGKFDDFKPYAWQECCYLEAEKVPGLYVVMNRDSGRLQKYIVNDFENSLQIDGFEHIELPVKFSEIVDKIENIEILASCNEMPEVECENYWFCRYKFLCQKQEEKFKSLDSPELLGAGKMYREGDRLEKQGKDMKETSKAALLAHSKANVINKFKAGGISFSYRGETFREWVDLDTFRKKASPELLAEAMRKSKPYDDCTIRITKEE